MARPSLFASILCGVLVAAIDTARVGVISKEGVIAEPVELPENAVPGPPTILHLEAIRIQCWESWRRGDVGTYATLHRNYFHLVPRVCPSASQDLETELSLLPEKYRDVFRDNCYKPPKMPQGPPPRVAHSSLDLNFDASKRKPEL